MGGRLMLHLDRDRDEPPACVRGNGCTHDLARKAQYFGHVDIPKFGNMERMPINGELIIGKVEAQTISFLALKARKACFLPILAWVFELGLRPLLLHAPIVGEGLPQIGKRLFWSALRGFVAPGTLLA